MMEKKSYVDWHENLLFVDEGNVRSRSLLNSSGNFHTIGPNIAWFGFEISRNMEILTQFCSQR